MIKHIKNIFLYFSAFIPMYFLIIIRFLADLYFCNIKANVFTFCVFSLMIFLIILGVIGLFWNIVWNKEQSVTAEITECQNITDQHFLGYFSIFILFALSFDLTKVSMFCVFIFITIFVGIVYINNKLFYINPTLNIFGFNFYEISYKLIDGQSKQSAKMFFRGKLEAGKQPRKIKLKNDHFSFIEKK